MKRLEDIQHSTRGGVNAGVLEAARLIGSGSLEVANNARQYNERPFTVLSRLTERVSNTVQRWCERQAALSRHFAIRNKARPHSGRTTIELAISASQRQARRAAMLILLSLQTRPAPSERNARRTFRPYGAWASWTGGDYKHCAPAGAYLRRGQAGPGLIQWQRGRGEGEPNSI